MLRAARLKALARLPQHGSVSARELPSSMGCSSCARMRSVPSMSAAAARSTSGGGLVTQQQKTRPQIASYGVTSLVASTHSPGPWSRLHTRVRSLHSTAPRRSTEPPKGEGSTGHTSGGAGHGAEGDGKAGHAAAAAGKKATQILHQGTVMYEDLERVVMKQIRATNQKRFRIGFASTLLITIWVVTTFGKQIRSFFSRHTAEVAKETLKDEQLLIQTRELSSAVVQFILNDQEVLSRATLFLQQAAENPETQRALVELAKHVFTHPETLEVVVAVAKELVPRVLQSKETLDEVAVLMAKVIVEPQVKEAFVALISELVVDEQVYDAFLKLVNRVVEHEDVQKAVNQLLVDSSHKVLDDTEVVEHSRTFVAEVVTDDSVQRTGGTAIWNSLQYSFQPKLMRALWFGLLCGLVAFIRSNARPPEAFG